MLHNSQSDNGPVAFIGHTSVTWLTSEHLAKIFFLRLLEGMDIGSALSSAKNAAILNRENIQDTTAKDFLSHLESSLVLYGIPQTESHNEIGYIDYTAQTLEQVDANPSTGEPIQWNSTVLISPKSDISSLYSGGLWQSTHGTVWYYNVTEPSSGKINITFVASLAGEYMPDPTAYNLNASSDDVNSVNITQMTVEVERTEIIPSSFSEQYNQSTTYINAAQITDDDLKYAVKSNRSLMLAILYSPNSTLSSSYSKTVNLTFVTEGVSIETISVSGSGTGSGQAENNITAVFNLVNPTEKIISNLTIKYPIPSPVLSCAVSGSDLLSGSCINATGYAKQNISHVLPGKTQYTLNYIADADMVNSTSVSYDYWGSPFPNEYVYNWGDNVTIKSNINVSSSTNTDVFTEIMLLKNTGNQYVDPVQENAIVWSNKTTVTLGPAKTMISPVWEIPANTSESQPGEYLIKTYVLENGTSKYLLKNIMYVNLTDEINLSITDTDISSNTVEGYMPEGLFNFSFTGSAKKQTGQSLNGTVIGKPSVYVYLDSKDTAEGTANITDYGQFDNIIIENINPGIGSHTLRIRVFDEFNNSKEELYPINVTNYAESLTVTTNTSGTANEEDWIEISGTIYGNDTTLKVYNADVTVMMDGEIICTLKSSTSGTYSCDWQVPYGEDDDRYTISVDATSPLNTSKTISNTTYLDVVWLNVTIDPQLQDIGVTSSTGFSKTVTVEGLVRYSENETISIVDGAAVECFIKDTTGWNYTVSTSVGTSANYSCEFSEGINHTGTYEVTVSATHDIDSRTVRGYIKQQFKIIDTTPDDDGPSSGGSTVGALPSGNVSTETTTNLNFSYFKTVEIEQGLNKKITITILNNGDETLHNLTINLSGVNWTDWYVVTSPEISSMSAGALGVFSINISVPQDAEVSNHTIEAKVAASETYIDDAITFTISVLPSNKSIEETRVELTEIEDTLSGYNDILKGLYAEFSDQGMLQNLFRPLNGTRIAEAKKKLIEANDLMDKARELLEAGDTIEAFKAKRQADILIAEIEKVIEEEEQKLFYVSKLLNVLKIVAVSMALISMLVGYMLLPQSKGNYTPKGEFFQKIINTKSYLNRFSQKLSEQFSKLGNKKLGKSGRKEEDLSGIKKIDMLHQKFENYHKKDD
ncbi:MAG: hypothetical protein U9O53_06805, partial [archaeon]|nr:hypothetical protein [archaeon]